jgi:hypothetical protein
MFLEMVIDKLTRTAEGWPQKPEQATKPPRQNSKRLRGQVVFGMLSELRAILSWEC